MILAAIFQSSHELKQKRPPMKKSKKSPQSSYGDLYRPIALVCLAIGLWTWSALEGRVIPKDKMKDCTMEIIDDFPENVTGFDYSQLKAKSTYQVYLDLFGNAKKEILIMDSSSNLRASQFSEEYRKSYAQRVNSDKSNFGKGCFKGNEIFELLLNKGKKDNVKIRILDAGKWVADVKNKDAKELHRRGAAERRAMDKGAEIQHTKAIIVDEKHTLITSANLDHLSLHQKGELGLLFKNCPRMAADTKQMYENWWNAGRSAPTAKNLPYSKTNRLTLGDISVHTAMSPASLRENGRDSDYEEMLRLIDEAEEKVDISVMDFLPFFMFDTSKPQVHDLTDALRRATARGVKVRLITMSRYTEWRNATLAYLKDVAHFGVELKLLSFPYLNVYMDRKSHGKYIITEKEVLISTSNFTPDYFFTDTGMALIVREKGETRKFTRQIEAIFERYWSSPYIYPIQKYLDTCVPISLDKDICDAINSSHDDAL